MTRGLFNIDRALFKHPMFKPKKYSRLEAWLWLISEARWKDGREDIGGQLVDLQRGQVAHSLRFMATAWGWNESGVRRFLTRLKTEGMIDAATDAGRTILTICNYNTYQSYENYRDAVHDAQSDARVTQERRKSDAGATQTIRPDETPDETPEETPDISIEKKKSDAKPKRRKRGTETPLPDGWEPDEKGREYARKHWAKAERPDLDFAGQVEKFHNHHRSRDNRMVSWPAAWRTWVGNAPTYTPRVRQSNGGGGRGAARSPSEQMSDAGREVIRKRAERRGETVVWGDESGAGGENDIEGDGAVVELFRDGEGRYGEPTNSG